MFFFLPLMSRGETDNDLVRRFKSGDRDAFSEIVLFMTLSQCSRCW